MFRLLDHVIRLYGTVLGMALAILVFAFNEVHLSLTWIYPSNFDFR